MSTKIFAALAAWICLALNVKAAGPEKQPESLTTIAVHTWQVQAISEENKLVLDNTTGQPVQLTVTDRNGNIVQSANLKGYKPSFSYRQLNTGSYNITLTNNEQNQTVKLLIL